jgi:hypothetical protein
LFDFAVRLKSPRINANECGPFSYRRVKLNGLITVFDFAVGFLWFKLFQKALSKSAIMSHRSNKAGGIDGREIIDGAKRTVSREADGDGEARQTGRYPIPPDVTFLLNVDK